jgi:hypothetical protein
MAIDPKKLSAFAKQPPTDENEEPDEADGDGEEGSDEEESGESEGEEEAERNFGDLVPLMHEFQDEIKECYSEMSGPSLVDPMSELSDEDSQVMQEGFVGLDTELKKELKKSITNIGADEAQELAEHCDNVGMDFDVPKLTSWLVRIGLLLNNGRPIDGTQEAADVDPSEDDAADEDDSEDEPEQE